MNKFLLIILLILFLIFFTFIFLNKQKTTPTRETEKKRFNKTAEEKNEIKKEIEKRKTKISLITLYDNYLVNPDLKADWGFSCLIEIANLHEFGHKFSRILFDTGADSFTLLANMKKLNIDPREIDIIVLSHLHQDHVGGLKGFLKENNRVKVYLPSSFSNSVKNEIASVGAEYIDVSQKMKISEKIWTTGELGISIKEQSLLLKTEKGLIVVTGCAHPGIVNIVRKAKQMFPEEKIYLVLGGFHLFGFSDSELKEIINNFKDLGVTKAVPSHCSGDRCRELFEEEYGRDYVENGAGKIIDI